MDGMDGHELLVRVRALYPVMPVILITAFGSIGSSVCAMRDGAVDYLLKPFKPEQLLATVEKYLTHQISNRTDPIAVEPSSQQLLTEGAGFSQCFMGIIGIVLKPVNPYEAL